MSQGDLWVFVGKVPPLSERLLVQARERGRLSISDAVKLLAVGEL